MSSKKSLSPDLIVSGAGISGVIAAVEAAARGMNVVVTEKRAYAGREIAAHSHNFVRTAKDDSAFRSLPDYLKTIFCQHDSNEIIVSDGFVRQQLTALLEEKNIPVLYEAESVGITHDGQVLNGLMLAIPAKLCRLPGAALIDAGSAAPLLRMINSMPSVTAGAKLVHTVFEMEFQTKADHLLPSFDEAFRGGIEDALKLEKNSLHFHSCLRNDVIVIEYAFRCDSDGALFETRSNLDAASRRKTFEFASYLRSHVDSFKGANLSHMANEAYIEPETAIPDSPYRNLFAAPELPWGFSLDDILSLVSGIKSILDKLEIKKESGKDSESFWAGRGFSVPLKTLSLKPLKDEALKVPLFAVGKTAAIKPLICFKSDVCVAGIGAAGGMAMLAAAERGASVTAIELNCELGGTYTAGRVCGYYEGYKGGANEFTGKESMRKMEAVITNPSHGALTHSTYLLDKVKQFGVRLFTGTRACGVLVKNGKLTEILAANEDGIFSIEAFVSIDTTGDADLVALAGLDYDIGDPEDGMMQSYSMWGAEIYPSPNFLSQRYLRDPDIFQPDVYSERLRAVSLAHRLNSPFHISPMITVREARRVKGDAGLTMNEILEDKVFDDVIAVASTQADSHAHTSSDLAKLGTVGAGKALKVRIPYGCFVPAGIDGLLVAAKAISGERDATCFCRMNADVKNAGYSVGMAAALIAKEKIPVRKLDVKKLQKELISLAVLPDWAFHSEEKDAPSVIIARLADKSLVDLDRILRMSAETALPLLEECYRTLQEASSSVAPYFSVKSLLAMALAWHGSSCGADHLKSLLRLAVSEGRHFTPPHIKAFRTGIVSGGHGEDDYAVVNRLLVMAGRSGSDIFASEISEISDAVPGLGNRIERVYPYDFNRDDMIRDPFYARIRNIAFAVSRKPSKDLIPAIERLLSMKELSAHDVPMGSQKTPSYQLAYLEFCLAKAAVRCGSSLGIKVLKRYSRDTHCFLRKHAAMELK